MVAEPVPFVDELVAPESNHPDAPPLVSQPSTVEEPALEDVLSDLFRQGHNP